ncbi:hypothetical protein AMATHDRAFT_50651 [Amanita thiersii Skay4041]|uniref:Uncharacterized protein n=1 Tax=Amanita thiersii Skay4041 TaxID=703135 RepID=A0A2A9NCA3_9AGAR|nr:hypothetical protein AMATHDRAFT_50651 [Amanita thiersii Skay4041]
MPNVRVAISPTVSDPLTHHKSLHTCVGHFSEATGIVNSIRDEEFQQLSSSIINVCQIAISHAIEENTEASECPICEGMPDVLSYLRSMRDVSYYNSSRICPMWYFLVRQFYLGRSRQYLGRLQTKVESVRWSRHKTITHFPDVHTINMENTQLIDVQGDSYQYVTYNFNLRLDSAFPWLVATAVIIVLVAMIVQLRLHCQNAQQL